MDDTQGIVGETMDNDRIIQVDISNEMQTAYLDYSMSVIVGRALPDARDGFKPVHRRVLFAMHELGVTHNKAYKKSARIVGETMGKYHPHGDTSIYDTLVRMAQEWSLSHTLVDGQGNFGNPDGDPPAAMRYTEARLTKLSQLLLQEIDMDTIDYKLNFDDSLKEPTVLPAMFPQLLVNGSTGIAVGMATSILPHNLREVINGTIAYIDNPGITDEEMMAHVLAPDFPTGGIIYGMENVRQGIITGRGSVKLRGEYVIEEKKGRVYIIITSVPWNISRDDLTEKIGAVAEDDKTIGISYINNESSGRDGTRIVVGIKNGITPEVVMAKLYKHTPLQSNYTIHNMALVGGRPYLLSTKDMIRHFVDFRREVTTRRLTFQLGELNKRRELLTGYATVLNDIDNAIKIIRDSREVSEARTKLIEVFGINEIQAKAVLELRLSKLTGMEIDKIMAELEEVSRQIWDISSILGSEEAKSNLIKAELAKIGEDYGIDRRTKIEYIESEQDMDEFVEKKDVIITISDIGYIKRTDAKAYRTQGRGGKGILVAKTKDDDVIKHVIHINSHDHIAFFTDKGKCYYIKAYQIPEGDRAIKGRPLTNFIDMEAGERVMTILPVTSFDEIGKYIFLCTTSGICKKSDLKSYIRAKKRGMIAISIQDGDSLLGAALVTDEHSIVLGSDGGTVIRFMSTELRPMGRNTTGNYGMKLGKTPNIELSPTKVVSMLAINRDDLFLIAISAKGLGKRTSVMQYRITGRNYGGVDTMKCTERTGPMVKLLAASIDDDVMITCESGQSIRIAVTDIREIQRNTQGVKLLDIDETDSISGATVIPTLPDLPPIEVVMTAPVTAPVTP
jgi:DNA gyrase subunit A